MTSDITKRFRALIAQKGMTLKRINAETGIPISTLSEMKRDDWAIRTITHLDAMSKALPALEAEAAEAEASQ